MADKPRDKSLKRKKKPAKEAGSEVSQLRQTTERRQERRYQPKASAGAVLTMVIASLAAVSVGAGTYGQWFRAEELGPHKYAFAMLAAGAIALIGVVLAGPRPARITRIGDAGVAVEKDGGEIDRVAWYEVTRVSVVPGSVITFQSNGVSVAIPFREQPAAAARAVAEARTRIPDKMANLEVGPIPAADADAGEVMPLEPPQVAGLHCKKSDKLIAFERDARLCGRCGEVYHKDGVPKRCLTCDAPL